MKRLIPKLLLNSLILLGIILPGIGGALHFSSSRALSDLQAGLLQGDIPTASPSSTPTMTPTLALETTARATLPLPAATEASGQGVYAFIEAPRGALPSPYVILSGFQARSFASGISLSGTLNVVEFTCPGSPCILPLELGDSRIIFKAQLSSGESSETIMASVRAEKRVDGYYVVIQSVSLYFGMFSDACLAIWDIEDKTYPAWAQFPRYPYELNTQTSLHNLAAQLIVHGLVDTRDCPAGGMSRDLTWPNGCGMERARPKMIEWQNQYDQAIWAAGNEIGIPPRILKTLIQIESQFWPENSRFYMDEYGLGQVNELGVDVLLRRDPTVYRQACASVLTNCDTPYMSLSPVEQAMVRGALLTSQNSSCPACDQGLDLTKAKQSVTFIAQVLRANCYQVRDMLEARSSTTDYESYWKLTMLSYHNGMSCLAAAVKEVKQNDEPMDWEHIAFQMKCPGGEDYVDGFWGSLNAFDNNRLVSQPEGITQYSPVFMPTRTPLPSPTPDLSSARIWVSVYIDSNGDGMPQPEEAVNGASVELELPDGRIISGITQEGQASFDLSGEIVGTPVVVRLPDLFREFTIFLPKGGTIPVLFPFAEPTLPEALP